MTRSWSIRQRTEQWPKRLALSTAAKRTAYSTRTVVVRATGNFGVEIQNFDC